MTDEEPEPEEPEYLALAPEHDSEPEDIPQPSENERRDVEGRRCIELQEGNHRVLVMSDYPEDSLDAIEAKAINSFGFIKDKRTIEERLEAARKNDKDKSQSYWG